MQLPSSLVKEFAKMTNDTPERKKESTVYGTVVKDGDNYFVRLDGSDILTPIDMAMDAEAGDRVIVMIKDHKAVITGNITSPASARKNTYIKTINDTLLLYGLDAVGIRSDSQVNDDVYRAEVVVNTEDDDNPIVQIQTYKVGSTTNQRIFRVSMADGVLINGDKVNTNNDYYRVGTVTLKGKIRAGNVKTYSVNLTKVPSGYVLAGIFEPRIITPTTGEFTINNISWNSTAINVNIGNYELYEITFEIRLTWLALKVSASSNVGNEIINLPDDT
jgi:hypothetical protein